MNDQELPLSNLYLTMLKRLGVETETIGGSQKTLAGVWDPSIGSKLRQASWASSVSWR